MMHGRTACGPRCFHGGGGRRRHPQVGLANPRVPSARSQSLVSATNYLIAWPPLLQPSSEASWAPMHSCTSMPSVS